MSEKKGDCIAEANEIPPRENIEAFNLNDKKEGARDDEEFSTLKCAGQFLISAKITVPPHLRWMIARRLGECVARRDVLHLFAARVFRWHP